MSDHTHDSELLSNALRYFLDYIRFDTAADPKSDSNPSTPKILVLAAKIAEDLRELGLEADVDEFGYLYSSIPATAEARYTLGLIAHMDTSPDFSGADVRARRIRYDGGDIILNEERAAFLSDSEEPIVLSPEVFPQLAEDLGRDIIVTDGHSLLGADNKAGVAEIMSLARYLTTHPELAHGEIKIAFTPDEEIGRGADHFDVARFGADFAYTVDGGSRGEIEWENFNAAGAKVTIKGRNVHPGAAKNKMINACLLAAEFIARFPEHETPQHTENREGFYHLNELSGDVELCELEYIIRDFELESFEQRKAFMESEVSRLNDKYGKGRCQVEIKDQYFNMKEKVRPYPFLIEYAKEAMLSVDVEPQDVPIRGGTDGARLSYMGLPCPNLFTGGENFHGRFEYLSVSTMEKACETLLALVPKFI